MTRVKNKDLCGATKGMSVCVYEEQEEDLRCVLGVIGLLADDNIYL